MRGITGLNNLHAFTLRPDIPSRWLHVQELLPVVQRSVDRWWLSFPIIGLSPIGYAEACLAHEFLSPNPAPPSLGLANFGGVNSQNLLFPNSFSLHFPGHILQSH